MMLYYITLYYIILRTNESLSWMLFQTCGTLASGSRQLTCGATRRVPFLHTLEPMFGGHSMLC